MVYVYRYLKTVRDFFVDTCIVRRTNEMMGMMEWKDDQDSLIAQRDIFM